MQRKEYAVSDGGFERRYDYYCCSDVFVVAMGVRGRNGVAEPNVMFLVNELVPAFGEHFFGGAPVRVGVDKATGVVAAGWWRL